MARVRVVGLGPGDAELLSTRTTRLLREASVARLRTAVHPAAAAFPTIASYDSWYESAASFDDLYAAIADDLVALAQAHPDDEVLYAVPGAPNVAETTVSLLLGRDDVEVICEPALSVIDVVVARLGRDPMASGLRIVDALGEGPLSGPGPLLVLQTYAPAVMAWLADRLPPATDVVVLHHVGLPDEQIVTLSSDRLSQFDAADHLTSVWVESVRTPGVALDELVAVTHRLRQECPWDQEQTHGSLARHLLEESYEALDALDAFVRLDETNAVTEGAVADLVEELGDVLFQVAFHAELGDEEDRFTLTTIADGVREKLVHRHPHVFGDAVAPTAGDVERRWEEIKKAEKSRDSVLDGVVWHLPALSLFATVQRKSKGILERPDAEQARRHALDALAQLGETADPTTWGEALAALATWGAVLGVDLESALRQRALALRDAVYSREASTVVGSLEGDEEKP